MTLGEFECETESNKYVHKVHRILIDAVHISDL